MPRCEREELQVLTPPNDCSKKNKLVVDNTKRKSVVDYERLGIEIAKLEKKEEENMVDVPSPSKTVQEDTSAIPMREETTHENRIASVKPELKENTAGEPVDTTNDCVNSNYVISLSECIPLGATVSHKNQILLH